MSSGLNQEFKQASVLGIMTVKAVWGIVCVAERGETDRRTTIMSLIWKIPEF